jgi:type II secretory pathway component PulF
MSIFTTMFAGFTKVGYAASRFQSSRLDYYANLADRMEATAGKKTLLDLLLFDVDRYDGRPRGTLSAHWIEKLQEGGGRPSDAFQGTLPKEEVMLMRVAEQTGQDDSMVVMLRDISRVGKVIQSAKKIFIETMVVAVVGFLLAAGMLISIPFFSVPTLAETFSMVPPEKWGPVGQTLLSISNNVKTWGIPFFGSCIAMVAWIAWSLPNWTGNMRRWCDRHLLIYQLYRDFKGAMFMATLSSMTQHQGSELSLIRNSLTLLSDDSSPWMTWHINQIIGNLDEFGRTDANAFNTGILDDENLYFFMEVFETRGFDTGMRVAGLRTEKTAEQQVARRAAILRWVTLGGSVAFLFYILGLHYRFVNEMKNLMVIVFG